MEAKKQDLQNYIHSYRARNMGGFGVHIINTLSSIVKLQVRFPLVQQNSCKSSESSAELFDNGMYVDMQVFFSP